MAKPKSSPNWPFRVPSRIRSGAMYVLAKTQGKVTRLRDRLANRWNKKQGK